MAAEQQKLLSRPGVELGARHRNVGPGVVSLRRDMNADRSLLAERFQLQPFGAGDTDAGDVRYFKLE